MNIPQKTLSLLAIASLSAFSSLSAVETDPVGYLTFTAADAADTTFGLPMEQAAVLATSVDSVISGTVTVTVEVSITVTVTLHICTSLCEAPFLRGLEIVS